MTILTAPQTTPSAAEAGLLRQFADRDSGTLSYLLACLRTRQAVFIDPVLAHVTLYLGVLDELGLSLTYTLDTHIHADHATAAAALRDATGSRIAVPRRSGARGCNLVLDDGDCLAAGGITLVAMHTPGHTPHCLTYRWRDRLFTGDSLHIGGAGSTGEPGGDPGRLYDSVTRLLLPLADETLVYPGHDSQGRRVGCIGEERRQNPLFAGVSRDEFISRRSDGEAVPAGMDEHIAANLRCGAPDTDHIRQKGKTT